MASFTGTLSDTNNQIGSYNPPADNSSAAIISAAGAIAGPLVSYLQKSKENKDLGAISKDFHDNYDKLVAARNQGSITTQEFYTRLNTRMRQYQADFPAIGGEIQQRLQKDTGVDVSQKEFESKTQPFRDEEEMYNKMYTDAQSYGLQAFDKEGKPDQQQTVDIYQSIRRKQLAATIAKDDKKAGGEVLSHLSGIWQTAQVPVLQQINKLASDPTKDDATKTAEARSLLAKARQQYSMTAVLPVLSSSKLDVTDVKNIREELDNQIGTVDKLLFDDNLGSFRDRSRLVEEMVRNSADTFNLKAPAVAGAAKALGGQAVSSAVSYAMTLGGGNGEPSPGQSMANSISSGIKSMNTFSNTIGTLDGSIDPNTLPPDQKKPVVKALLGTTKDLANAPKLDDKSSATHINGMNTLTNMALTSNNRQDMEYMLGHAVDPAQVATLERAAKGPNGEAAKALAKNNTQLAYTYLDRNKEYLYSQAEGLGYFEPQFNPSTGQLEIVDTVPKQPTGFFGGIANTTQKVMKAKAERLLPAYNNALTTFAKYAKINGMGGGWSDQQIKQYVVDMYGYSTNPKYKKAEISTKMDSMLPTSPSTTKQGGNDAIPEYSIDANGRLVPVGPTDAGLGK